MPPQNLPLWHIDYFEPQALEKQQTQGDVFFEFICLKANPPKGTWLS